MPKLKKKQMALMRHKEQKEAEFREQKQRLEREHDERKKFLVMHQQEISRMRSSTQVRPLNFFFVFKIPISLSFSTFSFFVRD